MTDQIREDSRLAVEALKSTCNAQWTIDCQEPKGMWELHNRLESGALVVAPANHVAGEGQVVVNEALLREVLKHVRFHGRAVDAAAFYAKKNALYAALGWKP